MSLAIQTNQIQSEQSFVLSQLCSIVCLLLSLTNSSFTVYSLILNCFFSLKIIIWLYTLDTNSLLHWTINNQAQTYAFCLRTQVLVIITYYSFRKLFPQILWMVVMQSEVETTTFLQQQSTTTTARRHNNRRDQTTAEVKMKKYTKLVLAVVAVVSSLCFIIYKYRYDRLYHVMQVGTRCP